MLVDALTKRWGWNLPPSGRGKIVWRWWSNEREHQRRMPETLAKYARYS